MTISLSYPKALNSVLELVGGTPLVKLHSFDTNGCELFVKLENQNPGGSIKDRIAVSIIQTAEESGELKPGGTIVEGTSGNTGLGLALVGRLKGYKVILVCPDKVSVEKIALLRAFGAEVLLTRSDVEKGHPEYYQEYAERIAQERPNTFYANQFGNDANPLAHEETTGPEIFEQMEQDVDAVVVGVGSSGTLSGLSAYFRKASPKTEIVLGDPEGSIMAEYVRSGTVGKAGSWLVEGMGEDFIPPICDISSVKSAYTINDSEAFLTTRRLLNDEGILAGTSAGLLVAAAVRYCQDQTSPKRVVTIICDSGSKYIGKVFNDYWMYDHGLISRETTGDLRDLIGRRYSEGTVVTVSPQDSLATTYKRMKMYQVSQLPVLKDGKVVGIIDEEDFLVALYDNSVCLTSPVSDCMVTELETLSPTSPLEDAIALVRKGLVPIVADKEKFYGLITKSDIVSYLRSLSIAGK